MRDTEKMAQWISKQSGDEAKPAGCHQQTGDDQKGKQCRKDDLKPQEKPFTCPVEDGFREKEHGRKQRGDGNPGRKMFHGQIRLYDPVLFQLYDRGMIFMNGSYRKRKR